CRIVHTYRCARLEGLTCPAVFLIDPSCAVGQRFAGPLEAAAADLYKDEGPRPLIRGALEFDKAIKFLADSQPGAEKGVPIPSPPGLFLGVGITDNAVICAGFPIPDPEQDMLDRRHLLDCSREQVEQAYLDAKAKGAAAPVALVVDVRDWTGRRIGDLCAGAA